MKYLKRLLSVTLGLLLWGPLIFCSLLLAHNAILYFTHGGEYGILPEKVLARTDLLWNICFYIHLPAGIFCMVAPFILFARKLFKQRTLHRLVGKLFVWITLVLVCPTGMYLALYAKGGLITQAGFMLQGSLLALFTWRSYQAIRTGHVQAHVAHMVRAYALAQVVLTFRIFHIVFFLWNVPYETNYAISQWLGMAANALLAECIIAYIGFQFNRRQPLKSNSYELI